GDGPHAAEMKALVRACYTPDRTLAEATRRFVHALFGRFGLVIVDGDDREFKSLFVPVMREEVLNGIAQRSVVYADEQLRARYPAQAHARAINLFHLRPGHRSRIEFTNDAFQVLDGGPRFAANELLLDMELRPQDYSPNVLLRPVYQETILPNIAYIGGGGELAYWMQLKWLFQAVQIPMPVVLLRTSAAFISAEHDRLRQELRLSIEDLFQPAHELNNRVAHTASGVHTDVVEEQQQLDALFNTLRERASAIDPTLNASAGAALVRAQRLLTNLHGKMDRALRRKESVSIARLQHLLAALFPAGGLQERRANILPMLASEGSGLLDRLLSELDPLQKRFTVFVE
ncbi:MAG TPA: bacillithiol biosynthesis BshC, partial [Flavobacteriales bacterium]|nr:bacillithiol biosynthesis BshC [Flavobacteriales bacterium]